MSNLEYNSTYRRNLPHIQPPGTTLFITFRLADSLPREVIERLNAQRARNEKLVAEITDPTERNLCMKKEQRRWFGEWDAHLDAANTGPTYLKDAAVASLVANAIHYRADKLYHLVAFCIMPNHVHFVCKPLEKVVEGGASPYSIASIMHSLKRYTAREANKLLHRTGAFWQYESYDHYVRDNNELDRVIEYVLNNPVKAGLVQNWQVWSWTYLNPSGAR